MFKQEKWSFTGASGTEYTFSILPKSEGLPQAPGVFILAYTHPRGHMAGWQVNPLMIDQAEDMRLALESAGGLDSDRMSIWNSNFVLLEAVDSDRKKCVHDLEILMRSTP